MTEIWKPVVGLEGRYEVSDLGRVRSFVRSATPYILATRPGWNGYTAVQLRAVGGKPLHRHVHHLVMRAFVGPPPEGMEIRHLNGDPLDPRLANLAYGTHVENMLDKRVHGTDQNATKTHCPKGHPYEGANLQIATLGGKFRKRVCRTCELARKAAWRRSRGMKELGTGLPPKERFAADPTLATHGKDNTYTYWGCRCDSCREAHTAAARRRAGSERAA